MLLQMHLSSRQTQNLHFFQYTDRSFKMSEFDESLMKACELLKDLTNDKTKCLKAFIDCQDVVMWLKESMKMCMSQLLFNTILINI